LPGCTDAGARAEDGFRALHGDEPGLRGQHRSDAGPEITAYEREIQQAQAAGIDGFALNVGGWRNQNYYIVYAAQMFEAAARLNTGFKLMFSADMCCDNAIADVVPEPGEVGSRVAISGTSVLSGFDIFTAGRLQGRPLFAEGAHQRGDPAIRGRLAPSENH
jgi:hypothetical protein